jgi:hypothetical protein
MDSEVAGNQRLLPLPRGEKEKGREERCSPWTFHQ